MLLDDLLGLVVLPLQSREATLGLHRIRTLVLFLVIVVIRLLARLHLLCLGYVVGGAVPRELQVATALVIVADSGVSVHER